MSDILPEGYPKAWITDDGNSLCVVEQPQGEKMREAANAALCDGGYFPTLRDTDAPFSVKYKHRRWSRVIPVEYLDEERWPGVVPSQLSGERVAIYVIPLEEVFGDEPA